MSLRLTPEMLAAAYELLRVMPPFKGWNLPHSDEIEFKVTRAKNEYGHYARVPRTQDHWIAISERSVKSMNMLLFWVAHEVVHLVQALQKEETPGAQHNAKFHRRAKAICRRHGWDAGLFS